MQTEIRTGVARADLEAILAKPRRFEREVFDDPRCPVTAESFVDFVMTRETVGGTMFMRGAPRMAAGATLIEPKIAFVWVVANVNLGRVLRLVEEAILDKVDQLLADGYTLLTTVRADNKIATAWAQRLGFEKAGLPAQDTQVYKRAGCFKRAAQAAQRDRP